MAEISVKKDSDNREKAIIKTSFMGIVINLLMAALKALVGVAANSIAIILDAVNNLSDAMSSVVTMIGVKMGMLPPNKKHPLGYGRIEYLSSMIVAIIVLYAGVTSLVESIKKIIYPEVAEYSAVSIVILLVAVVVKVIFGRYVKAQGAKYKSVALTASGTEAIMDSVLSATVIVSAIIYIKWNVSLEAYVGVLIAILIIKAGVEMLCETLDDILGKRSDRDVVKEIKQIICKEPGVRGAYDLIMYNYGPNKNYASVHVEFPDTMTVDDVDRASRNIQERVFSESGVVLTGIGVYSYNTKNDVVTEIRQNVEKIVGKHDWSLGMHGFYVDLDKQNMRFDVVVRFGIDTEKELDNLKKEINEIYPEYNLHIVPDVDV